MRVEPTENVAQKSGVSQEGSFVQLAQSILGRGQRNREAKEKYWTQLTNEMLPCEHARKTPEFRIRCALTKRFCICSNDSPLGDMISAAAIACPGAKLRDFGIVRTWLEEFDNLYK